MALGEKILTGFASGLMTVWCGLAGAFYFSQAFMGQRHDFGYRIECMSYLLPLLWGAVAILVSRFHLWRRGSVWAPPHHGIVVIIGMIGLGGLAALIFSAWDFYSRAEAVLLVWDILSFLLIIGLALLGGALFPGWRQGRSRGSLLQGMSLAMLGLICLIIDLVPRLRLSSLPGFPCIVLPLGIYGGKRLWLMLNRRGEFAERGPSVHRPNSGMDRLSPREREVVMAMSRGRRNNEIAEELHISLATVKKHLANSMAKTGSRNRVELAALIQKNESSRET